MTDTTDPTHGVPVEIDRTAQKFGPVWLSKGVTLLNASTLLYGAFSTLGLLVFMAVATPYVLAVNLGIPESEQGDITGNLAVWNEIALIAVFSPIGILADRIGRVRIYLFGYIGMAIGYGLYPWAGSLFELTIYRIIYAVGIGAATGMLGTIVADYSQEPSRGKMVSLVGIMNGLGVVVFTVILGRLPETFIGAGYDDVTAGRLAMGVVAALCLISGGIIAVGLKGGTPATKEERPPVKELMTSGLSAARNPRIAVAYAAAFIARSDLVILGTFVTLWGITAGTSQGMDIGDATTRGTLLFVTAQTAALVWAPFTLLFLDRVNRMTTLIICMGLSTLGYLSMSMVDNPLESSALPFFILLGVGQISAFFGATTLINKEAPVLKRASVIAMFNVFGAIGILVTSKVGGVLFDAVHPSAPFIFAGALNFCVVLAAIFVRLTAPGPVPHQLGNWLGRTKTAIPSDSQDT